MDGKVRTGGRGTLNSVCNSGSQEIRRVVERQGGVRR
jgi:hypothetical protein